MAETFNCPKCGAPLNLDPHSDAETVECPFCHETVIIPEDLRLRADIDRPYVSIFQQPDVTPVQPTVVRKSRALVWVLVVALACLVGIIPILLTDRGALNMIVSAFSAGAAPTIDTSAYRASSATTVAEIQASSATTVAETQASAATAAAETRASAATATAETQATRAALQSFLKQAQGWPSVVSDPFTDNHADWDTGDVRDAYMTGGRSIAKGVYTWDFTAVKSAFNFSYPTMSDQADFYASVDLKINRMAKGSDAGLVLRYNRQDKTWYYFSINAQGQYYLSWYDGSQWATLIPDTASAAIHPGETNHLAVAMQGSQFIFIINGQIVDHFANDALSSGIVGLGVNLPEKGDRAVIEFSNFSVLSAASP